MAPQAVETDSEIITTASSLVKNHAFPASAPTTLRDLSVIYQGWMRVVDGHRLWEEMSQLDEASLVTGWLLENYHYLSSAPMHCAAALAACPDVIIREDLFKHLAEETDHGAILAPTLKTVAELPPLERCRPLPTTAAFIGVLRDLAESDWRAYCIAIGFLQATLSSKDARHGEFYTKVMDACPEAGKRIRCMHHHDTVDTELDHAGAISGMLERILVRWGVDALVMERASLIVSFTWSFLDGIRCHYRHGPASLVQRIGWSSL